MTITEIENTRVNPEDQGVEVGEAGGKMGKDDFLQLLVTEMKNQNPLDPVDNKEMIAQLAQFSALEQMQNVGRQLAKLRQENGVISAIGLANQQLSVELQDGRVVSGVVRRVFWEDEELNLEIDGEQYAASDIVSLARIE